MDKPKFVKSHHDAGYSDSNGQRIAFVHHKGGTGKTTTCINVAGWLAKMNQRVLVVDLDPQANATTGLGVDLRTFHHSMYEVLLDELPINEIILETESTVYLAPASSNLLSAEIELAELPRSINILNAKLQKISHYFDFILVDCPPGSSLLMMNGMVATGNIIIPLDSGVFGFETLETLKALILNLEEEFDLTIHVHMAVLKVFSSSILDIGFTQAIRKMILNYFAVHGLRNCKLFNIPFSSKVPQAQMHGQPISHFAPTSKVARAYQIIAKNILLREYA